MENSFYTFPVNNFTVIKQQVLDWTAQFSTCCFLDNHEYASVHHRYECVAAAGSVAQISLPAGHALASLRQFREAHPGEWLFGHLGYDLKNEVEDLESILPDPLEFPDLFFFIPRTIIRLGLDAIMISATSEDAARNILNEISLRQIGHADANPPKAIWQERLSKEAYIKRVEALRRHILRGDCYEINFCQEFFVQDIQIETLEVYNKLSTISPSPFGGYYRIGDKYLLCASPERYLKKEGSSILSQPIKGTASRDAHNDAADEEKRLQLYYSDKDRSENVMVVDLVRNDLSKICEEGTVEVEELFGIYPFPQVYQMISTVKGELQPGLPLDAIFRNSFPMGSMTGAPKKKVMELIERYESVKRGIFSGALGYIDPQGDFDFNVVIRSMLYNQSKKYLSYLVGSAITFYSDAAAEYEECMLKGKALRLAL